MKDKQRKNKQEKDSNEVMSFLKTFLATFLIIMLVGTPLFAQVGEVLEMTPGGDDTPVLEEVVNFSELISTGNPFFDYFMDTNRVNILLLGVDHHNLTDLIMLASFDVDNRFLDVISIPRDTYHFRGPGFIGAAHHKINAVYRGNPVNTALAVSDLLMNIPINYYVSLSFEGVANIIDEIGGVPMYIERRMRYTDRFERPPLVIDIPAGHQVLEGETAIHFLRFRSYHDGDLSRIRNQQAFIRSAIRQSIGPHLPRVVESAFENINSDISIRTALHLATRAIGMDMENVRTHSMPIRHQCEDFIHPDIDGIVEMLAEIYSMELEIEDIEDDEYYDDDDE